MNVEWTPEQWEEYNQANGYSLSMEPETDLNEPDTESEFVPLTDEEIRSLWEYSPEEAYSSDHIPYQQNFHLGQAVTPFNFEDFMNSSNNSESGDALESDQSLEENRAPDTTHSETRAVDSIAATDDTEMEDDEEEPDMQAYPTLTRPGAAGILNEDANIFHLNTTNSASGAFSFPPTDWSADLQFRELNPRKDVEIGVAPVSTSAAAEISTKPHGIYNSMAFQQSSVAPAFIFPKDLMSAIMAPEVTTEVSKTPQNIFSGFKFDSDAFSFSKQEVKANPAPPNYAPIFSFGADSIFLNDGTKPDAPPTGKPPAMSAGIPSKQAERVVSSTNSSARPGEESAVSAVSPAHQAINNGRSTPNIAVSSRVKDVTSVQDSSKPAGNHTSASDLTTSTSASSKIEEERSVQTTSPLGAGNTLPLTEHSLAIDALKQQVSMLEKSLKAEKERSDSTIEALKQQVSSLEKSLEAEKGESSAACMDYSRKLAELEECNKQQLAKYREEKFAAESAMTPLRNEAHLSKIKLNQIEKDFEKCVQQRVAERLKEEKASNSRTTSQYGYNLADAERELATKTSKLAESLKREKKLGSANYDLALAATMALRGNDAYPELNRMAEVAESAILKNIAKRVVEELTENGPANLLFEAAVMVTVEADVEERIAEIEQRHSISSQEATIDGLRAEIVRKTAEWNANFITAVEEQVNKDITEKHLPQMQKLWEDELAKTGHPPRYLEISGSTSLGSSIDNGVEPQRTFKEYMSPKSFTKKPGRPNQRAAGETQVSNSDGAYGAPVVVGKLFEHESKPVIMHKILAAERTDGPRSDAGSESHSGQPKMLSMVESHESQSELERNTIEAPKTPRITDQGAGTLPCDSESQLDDPFGIYNASPPRMPRGHATSREPSRNLHVNKPVKLDNNSENCEPKPQNRDSQYAEMEAQDLPDTDTISLKPENNAVEPLQSETVLGPDTALVESQMSTKIRTSKAPRGVGRWKAWLIKLVSTLLWMECWFSTWTTYIPDPAIDVLVELATSSLTSLPMPWSSNHPHTPLLEISTEWTTLNTLLAWCPEVDSPAPSTPSATCPATILKPYHSYPSPLSNLPPRDTASHIRSWSSLSNNSDFDKCDPPSSPALPTDKSLRYIEDEVSPAINTRPAESRAEYSSRIINNGIWSFIGLNIVRFVVTGGTLLRDPPRAYKIPQPPPGVAFYRPKHNTLNTLNALDILLMLKGQRADMVQNKFSSSKENAAAGKGKSGKKAHIKVSMTAGAGGNLYALLDGKTGNPSNAKEFDEVYHDDDEMFFKLRKDFDGTDEEKEMALARVNCLNFIHNVLKKDMARSVPAGLDHSKDTEIYHRTVYNGISYDVGVHSYVTDSGVITAQAFAKLTDLSIQGVEINAAIWSAHAAMVGEAKLDHATKIISKLGKFYWAPRWKYVVAYLRERMYAYNEFGDIVPELDEPKIFVEAAENGSFDENDNTEQEAEMDIYSGSSGTIIGPKGSKIQELKSRSGVKDIRMPKKDEDAPRLRARDTVKITLIGTGRAISRARDLIQAIVDEWASAPRPPRDGAAGFGGGFNAGGGDYGGNSAEIAALVSIGNTGWGSVETAAGDATAAGADNDWADDANAEAAQKNAPVGGGDAW
ncbi:agglutinin receptor [Marssonina coronariae]|uniref:Agglutinin receptor n=1 Tax=Diplocarpon coronariae TaxID=2795749 RepID=A0A218YZ84_9HELO|nr:agglutinin receptor [Marssonina coronariae]